MINRRAYRLWKDDKLDLEDAQMGTCENCKKETWVRRVEAVGHGGQKRGWYRLCFKCYGPKILWRKGRMKMVSPLVVPYDELDVFLKNYFAVSDEKL